MESERGSSILNKNVIERATWASKLVLLCVGALSTATIVKIAVIPYLLDRSISLWASFRGSVSPFYIYIVVNFIIAAIAVSSSAFRLVREAEEKVNAETVNGKTGLGASMALEKSSSWDRFRLVQETSTCEDEQVNAGVNDTEAVNARSNQKTGYSALEKSSSGNRFRTCEEDRIDAGINETEAVNSRSNHNNDNSGNRFRTCEEEKLNCAEKGPPEEQESSMDDTWQAIVEGRRGLDRSRTMAPARRLERIDGRDYRRLKSPAEIKEKEVKKWRTFNDRVTLTREESISPEELSLRAEAFIKKVNDDMRLQRLESDQRYMDMVNRGL